MWFYLLAENKKKTEPAKRTHPGQQELYLAHLAKHDQLRTGAGDPVQLNILWTQLVSELNAYGAGPVLDVPIWQNSFTNWRNQVRFKARSIKADEKGTGGGAPTQKL